MFYDSDEEILSMNSTREHAESDQDIDKNGFIGNGSEFENHKDHDSIDVPGLEAMVMPMLCVKLLWGERWIFFFFLLPLLFIVDLKYYILS